MSIIRHFLPALTAWFAKVAPKRPDPTIRKFSQKNAYDRFSLLNSEFKKRYETYDVKMPDYVTVTYEVMVWTNFTEHNNKIIEQFQYFTGRYWGEEDKYKFRVMIDNFDNQQDVRKKARKNTGYKADPKKCAISSTISALPSTHQATPSQSSQSSAP